MSVEAIIIARGGSKGIPEKNIIDFCGKPLITWTIEQCLASKEIDSVWVSSDDQKILNIAEESGSEILLRPDELSTDLATSESAWINAIDQLRDRNITPELIIAPQVTSPLRESLDFDNAVVKFLKGDYDSMFSCCPVEDLFFWEKSKDGTLESVNYDYQNRKRRQEISNKYIENGSFYLFTPESLLVNSNRFGTRVGLIEMEFWKMFEIDSLEDCRMCSALMKEYIIK